MRRRFQTASFLCFAAVVSVAAGRGVVAQQTDPQIGVWKLNLAKSKYAPGPLPKSAMTKIEAADHGSRVTVDSVDSDGTVRHWAFTSTYDGKDAAITGNSPYGDTISRTRVNPTTVQATIKRGGKPMITQTSVVSADGKTRTVTTKGTDAQNRTINNVAVYDRQ